MLKPYNPAATCPKCGAAAEQVRTFYVRGKDYYYPWECEGHHKITTEHLHRNCARCHYQWPEACLDVSVVADD